jgi:hypothetical protein
MSGIEKYLTRLTKEEYEEKISTNFHDIRTSIHQATLRDKMIKWMDANLPKVGDRLLLSQLFMMLNSNINDKNLAFTYREVAMMAGDLEEAGALKLIAVNVVPAQP